MKNKLLILFSLSFFIVGCEKLFLGDEPGDNPKDVFNQFWNDFDMYYAHFQIKNINWDSVYVVNNNKINSNNSDVELYSVLEEIVLSLKDAHVNLYTPYGNASYNYYGGSPSNSYMNLTNYIIPGARHENIEIMEYRNVRDGNFGYLLLKTFVGLGEGLEYQDKRYLFIDQIIDEFYNKDGIIIDLRNNGGGNSANADIVASRFFDKRRLHHKQKYKDGPNENDFSEWIESFIEPGGNKQYLKPVVLLTNKRCLSSAEWFVSAMETLPHVTIIGDTTGGGSGNPVFRELPNGWSMRLSTSYSALSDGFIYEGKGIPPDIPIWISTEDSINGRDVILERAIEFLNNK
jgi:hypothetical protein